MQFISQRQAGSKLTSARIMSKDIRDSLLSTVFFIVAYAPSPFGFFIYIAFIPLLFISKRNTPGQSFIFGYLIGLSVNVVTLYWLFFYSGTGFSIIAIGNALQFGILTTLLSFINRRNSQLALFTFPFLWTFLEYIRQFGDLAFTWLNIAHTQSYFIYIIQYVEYTGYLGVVFWICLVNISIYMALSTYKIPKKLFRYSLIVLLLFLIPLGFGLYKLGTNYKAPGISVGYIQPNIDPDLKWSDEFLHDNLPLLISLTDSIVLTDPDLIVWPETSIPYYLKDYRFEFDTLRKHVRKENYHLLAGTLDYEIISRLKRKFNAAYFLTPNDSNPGIYRKLRLVPEEEKFPYKDLLPEWLIGNQEYDMTEGRDAVVFNMQSLLYQVQFKDGDWRIISQDQVLSSVKLSALICYESIFPNLTQKFIENGSQILIIITNDGWFGYTSQPFQHLQSAVFRALEQRISVVRCANTGISSFIDPFGRLYLESGLFQKVLAQKTIPLRTVRTFYSKYGDWLGIFCGILLFSCLTLLALSSRWKKFAKTHN